MSSSFFPRPRLESSPPHSEVSRVIAAPSAVDVMLRYLLAEDATTVFGVPGGLLHPFFDAVERHPEFRLIVTKHEEGAAFMADGFARMRNRLAVCAGTSGPGATNLLTGVSVAYADGIPLLVITGQAPSSTMGKGAAQETSPEDMDSVGMFRSVTKYSALVQSPDRLGHHLRRALRMCLSGRPGPVHLNVPVDFWGKPVAEEQWFDPKTYRSPTSVFDRNAVASAAQVLLAAKRPLLLVGSGVVGASAEEHVRTLAELLPARVATTPRAKGAFPEDHELSLGVLGFAGHREAKLAALGSDCDVLFSVGASLNETTTFTWDPNVLGTKTHIQLDIDPDRIGRGYPVHVPLVGDAQTILVELIYHIHRSLREGRKAASTWKDATNIARGEDRYERPDLRASNAIPITPQRWRVELGEALPGNAVVFSDIGGHMLFNIHDLCIGRNQRFVLNLGFGSMGHGTCAPIGAKLADPSRPVVAIIGDACFTMNGMELLTANEYDVPVIWIIENNQMHGITWHGSRLVNKGRAMDAIVYKKPLDVAGLARAMGLDAYVVDRPGQIGGALRSALESGRPTVIDVRVDGSISPPLGDRAKTVAGFKGHDERL
ncbi:acetolactate synthase large subunit [soil metagenome]